MQKMVMGQIFTTVALDGTSATPLYRQLYDRLRAAILSGQLPPGTRLPSTRTLAEELGVSRNTVVNAFDQLLAEGYIEGHIGAGTYVSRSLPDELLEARGDAQMRQASPINSRAVSRRGGLLASTRVGLTPRKRPPLSLQPGTPALDRFPFDLWAKLTAARLRHPAPELFGYTDSAGYWPLREAIATYLVASRAVRCSADQVIVTSGSQQALDLAARVLLDPGDSVWVENPCYLGARGALTAAGAKLLPVPVDAEGFNVAVAESSLPPARLAYVTPSHQFPLGVTMSLARRLALIDWAARNGAWVLEDDYDSEFRFAGRPLAALQGLDQEGRVIYIGTFSKVLFPGLRLGYLVVPPDLVDSFVSARALADRHAPLLEQAVLADFISEGHFARHIRRMRALYAERQQALLAAAHEHLAGQIDLAPAEAGMHLVGWLPHGIDDQHVSDHGIDHGVYVPPISPYALAPLERGGLLLGYAAAGRAGLREGVRRLARAIAGVRAGRP